MTDGTALDVETGDAQHEVANGLWPFHGGRRLRQENAAVGERRHAAAIGEQAEVANADEAVGHDVEHEAAEKFVEQVGGKGCAGAARSRRPSAPSP